MNEVSFQNEPGTGYTFGYCNKRKESLLPAELFGKIDKPKLEQLKNDDLAVNDNSQRPMVFASELKRLFPTCAAST
jgi:hypothetical protein